MEMTSFLSARVRAQQFDPGILGIFTNPFYISRKELRRRFSALAPKLSGRLLDVGCGEKPYEKLFTAASEYVGLEYDGPRQRAVSKADVFYDGVTFPFPSQSFDSVFASEVLEHVFAPEKFFKEIHRVLRPGGMLLLSAPFLWDEHEQPHDYARYSSFGLKHLAEQHGFAVLAQHKTAANLSALAQLWNEYIYKKLPKWPYAARLPLYILLIAPGTILGLLLSSLLPKNDDFYLANVVLAKKI